MACDLLNTVQVKESAMSKFNAPVSEYMSTPITAISLTQNLDAADRILQRHNISAIAVTADDESLAGVVSRSDLLRAGDLEFDETLRLPDKPVSDVMSTPALTVDASATLTVAAGLLVKRQVHRAFVLDGNDPVGVISATDLMRAVYDQRVIQPLSDFASRTVITLSATDPLALAVDRLDLSNRHGLVVTDGKWPVGVFTQRDALLARAKSPKTPVGDVMDPRVVALPPNVSLYRAAEQSLSLGVRRTLVVDDGLQGILAGLDFAAAVK